MVIMVINITWQVLSRYIFHSPSNYTEEMSSYMMVWMCFLGGSYLLGKGIHPAIDIIISKLPERYATLTSRFSICVMSFFALGVLIYGGTRLVYVTYTLDQRSAALNLPIAVVYSVIPISGVIMMVYLFLNYQKEKNNG